MIFFFKKIKMTLEEIIYINNYFKCRIDYSYSEKRIGVNWMCSKVSQKRAFVLGLAQFAEEERGREIPCIPDRENSTSRSIKTDKERSKV